MIRLFKEYAEYVYLALIFLRQSGIEPKRILKEIQNHSEALAHDPSEMDTICAAYHAVNNNFANKQQDQVIEDLAKQLQQARSGASSDGELLNQVIKILSLAFPRNQLNHGTITLLRRLLLTPEELTEIRTALTKVELQCAGCKRQLQVGEMITLSINQNRRDLALEGAALLCLNCYRPEWIPSTCNRNHWIRLSKKMLIGMPKALPCHQCQEEEQPIIEERPRQVETAAATPTAEQERRGIEEGPQDNIFAERAGFNERITAARNRPIWRDVIITTPAVRPTFITEVDEAVNGTDDQDADFDEDALDEERQEGR